LEKSLNHKNIPANREGEERILPTQPNKSQGQNRRLPRLGVGEWGVRYQRELKETKGRKMR